jgi:hypothetical protein
VTGTEGGSTAQWILDLGITDRQSGLETARASRVPVQDAAWAAIRNLPDLTSAHFLLLGLTARAEGLHSAAMQALEADNPYAAFTLIRAYTENAAAVLYAIGHPGKIDAMLELGDATVSIGQIISYANQGSKRFGAFKDVYSQLSQYAHPMSRSIFASHTSGGGDEFRFSSQPAFKFENDFLTASAWIVEMAEAHAALIAELGEMYRPA